MLPVGSNSLTDAYLKRILFYQDQNEIRTNEYFTKVADNKFVYYQNIFQELDYEEHHSAYALDTLFFDYFFEQSLPHPNADTKKFEEFLYYSSTWKNYRLLSEKRNLLKKQSLKLKNKQAIIDVIRFSEQGKVKYAITVFANKLQTTEVLSGDLIENRAFKVLSNHIKYKSPIPPVLLKQFLDQLLKSLKK